ncbi:PadR family transcriptional regulator [Alicyclobacillus fodiniaquatilis]|uniref:PadR family transcriptional regulator n=1 Tax=Alicyclobacillus fodiniaquatilis TaxID=1661150 RepID=A0ABW4JK84_9BACL
MQKDGLRGHLDGIILAILINGDAYGYDIAQQVHRRTEGVFSLKEGSLYPALKRLEAEQFIQGYWGTDKENGPRRRYYHLTERGKQHFEVIRAAWMAEQRTLSLFFGKVAPQ